MLPSGGQLLSLALTKYAHLPSVSGHKLPPQQNSMQGTMTMDIGDTVDNPTMMDSEEDLVPSLQVLYTGCGE